MSIAKYPNDNYHLLTCYDHLLAEIILDAHDADYICYEGTLVDNYIVEHPQPFDIANVKDLAGVDWDDEFVTFFKTQQYKYLVILERFKTQWSSSNELIYTNDENWVASVETALQPERELQLV